jgi:hypothetical protein
MSSTWPDVVDTALKIGLPATLAAGATIFAVYVNRTTELRKDARRRRQDALEKIIDKFEGAHAATCARLGLFGTYCQAKRSETTSEAMSEILREAEHRNALYFDTIETLSTLIGRANMLGLSAVAEILSRYVAAFRQDDRGGHECQR